ncbi:hypothetical protein DFJ77DRAFT_313587 [Powellomyces hirtus]|nr:hypothetical protein DFJ77DRAFT_313587 [Powellomyces hirtus]
MLHTTLLYTIILALVLVLQQHQASGLPTFKGVGTCAYPRSLFAKKNVGGVQMRGIDSPDQKGHKSNSNNNSTNGLLGTSCTPKEDVWACRGKVFMTCTFQDRVWVSEETCQIECVQDPAIRPLCFRNSNGTAVRLCFDSILLRLTSGKLIAYYLQPGSMRQVQETYVSRDSR